MPAQIQTAASPQRSPHRGSRGFAADRLIRPRCSVTPTCRPSCQVLSAELGLMLPRFGSIGNSGTRRAATAGPMLIKYKARAGGFPDWRAGCCCPKVPEAAGWQMICERQGWPCLNAAPLAPGFLALALATQTCKLLICRGMEKGPRRVSGRPCALSSPRPLAWGSDGRRGGCRWQAKRLIEALLLRPLDASLRSP